MPEMATAGDGVKVERGSAGLLVWSIVRAMRPAQWLKNGVVFAGLVFGSKLLQPSAIGSASLAAILFCFLSSGFYLVNDVRDLDADRKHPIKRNRPVASGQLTPALAFRVGVSFVALANVGALLLGGGFVLAVAMYTILMVAYNLGLKDIVILDVLAIASGFVIRAAAGALAVDVSISPWLLTCTMLLALLIGFGKRRNEIVSLNMAGLHRRNLDSYSQEMLDQAVAVTAAGTLIAYVVYTIDAASVPQDHRMMLTIPLVAYGIFRYLFLLHRKGQGGAPEALLLTDWGLLAAVICWGIASALLFYLAS